MCLKPLRHRQRMEDAWQSGKRLEWNVLVMVNLNTENAKGTGNAINSNILVCSHAIHGAAAPEQQQPGKNTRYLPTAFICGAINNIEINYRLKLTVINHFIFIISSSLRLSRHVVCVHTRHHRRNTIYARYLRIACSQQQCTEFYWKTSPPLPPPSAAVMLSTLRCLGVKRT